MKLHIAFLSLLTLLCFTLVAVPPLAANVQPVWSNGPLNGYTNAWTINYGYAVSDSFWVDAPLCPGGCSGDSFTFGLWVANGDTLLTVDWSIGTTPFGGNITTSNVFSAFQFNNHFSSICCDIYLATVSIPSVPLAPGEYWLTLQNAFDLNGGPVYWDQNDGAGCTGTGGGAHCTQAVGVSNAPATGCILALCPAFHSEDPDFYGSRLGGSTPEPSSILLFGSGILGIACLLRRKANL